MNITVMVMMIVEMGVMRWAVKISVMLQHRWESPIKEINPSTVWNSNNSYNKDLNPKGGQSLYSLQVLESSIFFHLSLSPFISAPEFQELL